MPLLKITLQEGAPIETALKVIDQNGGKIVLVVNEEGRLEGTVSDGDIRRGLLRGQTLSDPISSVMNASPLTINTDMERDEALRLMQKKTLRHLPVLDANGRVVALRTMEDLVTPEPKDNWIVILAGGEGRRLRPLTENCPKPMLPMGERPLLEQTITRLKDLGYSRFYLSVNYMADTIKSHFGDGSDWNVEIRYLREDQPLGTAGPLGLLPEKPEAPVIVMNGDIMTQLNFPAMIDYHNEHNALATMGVREYEVQVPYGVINVDEMRITSIEEKPMQRHLISAGIYVLSPDIINCVEPNVRLDMPDLFMQAQSMDPNVAAYLIREYWIDIGHMDDLSRARRDFQHMFPKEP